MGERHFTLDVVNNNGLSVAAVVGACCAVADMADRNAALAEPFNNFRRENVVNKACILIRRKNAVIVHNNSAGLLAAVLQGKKSVVNSVCNAVRFGRIHAENAAFFS